jgi:hypothetical protein
VRNTELRRREGRRSRQSLRQLAKQGGEREGVREPHEPPPGGVGDQRGDCHSGEPHRIELRATPARREWCALRAQGGEEHRGGGVLKQTKEVGGKGVAGEPIGLECVFAVFAEILPLPPLTIGVVEEGWRKLWQRSHHKPRILALLGALRFHHNPSRPGPTLCRIGKGGEGLHGVTGRAKAGAGFGYGPCSLAQQHGILRHAHDVDDPAQLPLQLLAQPQQTRERKRAIAAHDTLPLRKPRREATAEPAQDPHGPTGGMGIARPEHRPHEVSALSSKAESWMLHGVSVRAVKERELLLAVGGIIGGVDIQDDPLRGLRERPHLLFFDLPQHRPQRAGVDRSL